MARLNWRGEELKQTVQANAEKIMQRIGLEVEGEAKKELYKDHGVLTGTLRRDIHTEGPETNGSEVRVQVGAWVDYALPVHQGHQSFAGYHFITKGLEKVKARVDSIISQYRIKQ